MNSTGADSLKALAHDVIIYIEKVTGLVFQEKDKPGIESKLRRHANDLGFSAMNEYAEYLRSNMEQYTPQLISLVTTHHTAFFREFIHFEELESTLLPLILKHNHSSCLRVWSAAASLGHEAYSLAMFFDFLKNRSKSSAKEQAGLHLSRDFRFQILATDIDEQSVERGRNGVYLSREVNQSPAPYLASHWAKGKNELASWVKARQSLKEKIVFKQANLLTMTSTESGKSQMISTSDKMDLIFCRNVFLYFSPEQIRKTVLELLQRLQPWGVLFLGVCENLNDMGLPVVALGHSIYVPKNSPHIVSKTARKETLAVSQFQSALLFNQKHQSVSERPKNLRVIVVDDSPTVLALMRKILCPEKGFEVVATAKNIAQAKAAVSTVEADLMTLDLNLGSELGTDYLRAIDVKKHIPVVLVSGLSREQEHVAQEALRLGALDYVEKPEGANLERMGEELRAKLHFLLKNRSSANDQILVQADKQKSQTKSAPMPSAIRVLILDDSPTMARVLSQMISQDPRFQVVGAISSPSQLHGELRRLKPDVLTLDMNMPEMNGVEVMKRLPADLRLPVVVVSSLGAVQGSLVLEALQLGAVDYFSKPSFHDLASETPVLLEKLETASRLKNRSIKKQRPKIQRRSPQEIALGLRNMLSKADVGHHSIVGIGASTGGTEAIRELLNNLPKEMPPVVIVQHIPPVFSTAFAQRLQETCGRPVHEVQNGEILKPGFCYVAPGDRHFLVRLTSQNLQAELVDSAKNSGHKPSVDTLFESMAQLKNTQAYAVLMTGMGKDGAAGLLKLRERGARTICQSEESCVVYGMPRAGVLLGAAEFITDLEDISNQLVELLLAS